MSQLSPTVSPAELEARLRLHCLPELGPRRFRKLLSAFDSASAALSAPASAWRALGLPAAWPWYPLLLWGPRCLRSLSMRLLPFTRPWWRRWGRWQQQAFRRATAQALNEHGLTRPVP